MTVPACAQASSLSPSDQAAAAAGAGAGAGGLSWAADSASPSLAGRDSGYERPESLHAAQARPASSVIPFWSKDRTRLAQCALPQCLFTFSPSRKGLRHLTLAA